MKKLYLKYKGELIYTFSSYTTPVITMVTNVISAAFLKPAELGVIQSVMILLPYLAFMHFGVFNGLNRNLAYYKAQDRHDKVQEMVNASATVAIVNSVVGCLIGVCYLSYYILYSYPSIYFFSGLLLITNLLFNPLIVHYDTTYRSSQNFKTLGKITLAENFIYAFANLLPIWIGYLGKIVANGLRVIVRFAFRYGTRPYKATAIGRWADMVSLAKVGAPLLLAAYLGGIILVSDQTLILTYLGSESLGLYSLSVFLMTAMVIIPTSINTLLYPKAAAQYGKTKSNVALRPFFWKALLVNSLVLLPVCFILFFALGPLTSIFLPKYTPGVRAAQINLLTCLTFVSNGPSVIIGVLRKNIPLLLVYGLALAVIWSIGWFMNTRELTIESIAWLRFAISSFISLFTLLYAYHLTRKNAHA